MSAKQVTIVDLGLGNLHSVARAFERAGANPTISDDPDALRRAERVVVPGQGAIRRCVMAMNEGFGEALVDLIRAGKPYLGICLGMQALFESSEEAPGLSCMGLFEGRVVRFEDHMAGPDGSVLKVPHIGWNSVDARHPSVEDGAWYYFVHSFYCAPKDDGLVAATADFGRPFCAAIAKDNVVACQFHPEKSHRAGGRFLSRFLEEL